jgi:hypothetical protein
MMVDKMEGSRLIVEINKKVLVIQSENGRQAQELKKYFEEMKTLMFKYQLSLLVKQTEWMLEEATLIK